MFDDQEFSVSSYSWSTAGCAVHGAETRAIICGGAASQKKVYILLYLISAIRPSNHFNK